MTDPIDLEPFKARIALLAGVRHAVARSRAEAGATATETAMALELSDGERMLRDLVSEVERLRETIRQMDEDAAMWTP